MSSAALAAFASEFLRLSRLCAEASVLSGFDAQAWQREMSNRLRPLMVKLSPEEILLVLRALP